MNRIDKEGKKIKLNIIYIYNKKGKSLKEILKDGYLEYLKSLANKSSFKL